MWSLLNSQKTLAALAASVFSLGTFSSPTAVAATPAAPERTLFAATPQPLQDFELTSQEGKLLRLSQLRGAPVLLFFGFTHCPSVCPAALQELRQLETKHARELGSTRIVIVSVDGERDTPAVMAKWLQAVSPGFIGLTGQPAEVRDIAAQFSAAFFKTPGATPQEYLVEHNAQIFLIDAEGKLRATFFSAPVAVMAQVTASVLKEKPPAATSAAR